MGWCFIGDNYSDPNGMTVPKSDPIPMDCSGHGSHVAGIIGDHGPRINGVAPGATLGMYRVTNCPNGDSSESPDDLIVSALKMAYNDGCHIINLSLGKIGWDNNAIPSACSKITSRGVVVVAINGNNGEGGMLNTNSPSVGRDVISVGSVSNWNFISQSAIIRTRAGLSRVALRDNADDRYPFLFNSQMPLVFQNNNINDRTGCSEYSTLMKGQIVFAVHGGCKPGVKARNALKAGAAGIIIGLESAEDILGIFQDPSSGIPIVLVNPDVAGIIFSALFFGNTMIEAASKLYVSVPSSKGGKPDSFSLYGSSPYLEIGPNTMGPGGDIYSTYTQNKGGHRLLSGTSMASPYIAGSIALIKQTHPIMPGSEIQKAIYETAKPIFDDTIKLAYSPYKVGSGLINVYAAINARASIEPSGFPINNTDYKTFTVGRGTKNLILIQ